MILSSCKHFLTDTSCHISCFSRSLSHTRVHTHTHTHTHIYTHTLTYTHTHTHTHHIHKSMDTLVIIFIKTVVYTDMISRYLSGHRYDIAHYLSGHRYDICVR